MISLEFLQVRSELLTPQRTKWVAFVLDGFALKQDTKSDSGRDGTLASDDRNVEVIATADEFEDVPGRNR